MVYQLKPVPIACHRIVFRDELARWMREARFAEASRAKAQRIVPGNPLELEIIAPSGRVTSIDLFCATYLRRIGSSLFAELFDRDGNALACRMITGPDIADNTYHPFIVGEDLALEPGAKYRLVVSSIAAPPTTASAFGRTPARPETGTTLNFLSPSAESGRSYTPRTRPR